MADSKVVILDQAPVGLATKNADTEQLVGVGGANVERQRFQLAGATLAEIARLLNADPAGGEYGLVVRPIAKNVYEDGVIEPAPSGTAIAIRRNPNNDMVVVGDQWPLPIHGSVDITSSNTLVVIPQSPVDNSFIEAMPKTGGSVDVTDRSGRQLGVADLVDADTRILGRAKLRDSANNVIDPMPKTGGSVDVTDRVGRALGVIASITAAIDVADRAARVLGRAQLLDSASAVIDPATKAQLPAALVGGRLSVDASGVAIPITDNAGSLTVDAPVGTPVFSRLSDGAAALIGQKVMASSLPVAIASDQGAVPTNPSDNVARLLGKTQERENGYAHIALYAEAVAGIIAETAISMNLSRAFAAPAAATSNGAAAAKELVILGLLLGWVSTSTTANTARFRLRVNPAGAALITSPIAFTMRIGWESATFIANEEELQPIFFPKAIIIPNPGQVMATLACVAANGTLDAQLICYERTP